MPIAIRPVRELNVDLDKETGDIVLEQRGPDNEDDRIEIPVDRWQLIVKAVRALTGKD